MSDSGDDGSLEAGEIPGLPFPSDGSFFGNFFKGELQNSNGKKMEGATKSEQSGEDLKSIADIAALRPSDPPISAPPESTSEAKEGDSQQKAAAEPAPKPTKPTMIVKSKRAIPNVRLRPGVQGPAAKRSKGRNTVKCMGRMQDNIYIQI